MRTQLAPITLVNSLLIVSIVVEQAGAHHLRFFVKGDSDERGAVTLHAGIYTDVDRDPFQGGRERRLHALVPRAHVDKLRFR